MKIYTKTGDDGSTGLIGGQRIAKSDARIGCTGAVDELNASIGWVLIAIHDREAQNRLLKVQNDLFVIGSHLAVPDATPTPSYLPAMEDSIVARLEMEIDASETQLLPLRNFILPGGGEASARLHLARTICRRAERVITTFAHDRPLPAIILTYLNRLSDWLFVEARLANHRDGIEDVPWKPYAR